MSGIALCSRENNECPNKDKCLRYIQESNEYSSFCDFPKICNEDDGFTWLRRIEESVTESRKDQRKE